MKIFTLSPGFSQEMTKIGIYNCVQIYKAEATRPMHQRTNANLYPPEKHLNKASETLFGLKGGDQGQICPHSEDSQHDFLQVGFTLQTSRTNNKQIIGTLSLAVLI